MKRKWFWSGGRPKYEGDGAIVLSSFAPRIEQEKARESVPLPIGDFLQKKFGFRPKGTAINHRSFIKRGANIKIIQSNVGSFCVFSMYS